jgi:hypothetical protein
MKTAECAATVSQEEKDYWQRRAEEQIALAQQARHKAVVRAHYELANQYLELIHGDSPRSTGGLFSANAA